MRLHSAGRAANRKTLDLGETGILALDEDGCTVSDITIRATLSASRVLAADPTIVLVSGRDVTLDRVTLEVAVDEHISPFQRSVVAAVLATSPGLTMRDCVISIVARKGGTMCGVYATETASVQLAGCSVHGFFTGYIARGPRASLTATASHAGLCGTGFNAERCARVRVEAGCTLDRTDTGFLATDEARMVVAPGCRVESCQGIGFLAEGPGSIMIVGEGCVVSAGREMGHEFASYAVDGGTMQIKGRCVSKGDINGFVCTGGGVMSVGPGCSCISASPDAPNIAFASYQGSLLTLAEGCTASGYKWGFLAVDLCGCVAGAAQASSAKPPQEPARLITKENCVADRCANGFIAKGRSFLEVGPGGRADRCSYGFAAMREGAVMAVGKACVALECLVGFFADKGARVTVGPGCKAKGPEGAGNFAAREGGVVEK